MSILSWLKNELTIIEADIAPAVKVVESDIPSIVISAIEAFLTAIEAGTPWATVLSTVGALVESQGIKAGESAVQAAVNQAENNLIVAGTPAPITVAAATAASAATALPDTAPAVVAAQAVITAATSAATAGQGTN